MTSPAVHRDLLVASVRLRDTDYTVKGFIEDGCFIPDSFEPYLDYNSLSDAEWAEVDYQFWSQYDMGEDKPDDDWDDEEEE